MISARLVKEDGCLPADGPENHLIQSTAEVERLYLRLSKLLWVIFYRHCADADLAREAVQEAFLRLQRMIPIKLKSPRAWLKQVGLNWIRDALRKRRKAIRTAGFLKHHTACAPSVQELFWNAESRNWIRERLRQLNLADRQVLVLRYGLDWSSIRIGGVLGIAPCTVDMQLSRARRRFGLLLLRESQV